MFLIWLQKMHQGVMFTMQKIHDCVRDLSLLRMSLSQDFKKAENDTDLLVLKEFCEV